MVFVGSSGDRHSWRGNRRSCNYTEMWRVRTGREKEGNFWEWTLKISVRWFLYLSTQKYLEAWVNGFLGPTPIVSDSGGLSGAGERAFWASSQTLLMLLSLGPDSENCWLRLGVEEEKAAERLGTNGPGRWSSRRAFRRGQDGRACRRSDARAASQVHT